MLRWDSLFGDRLQKGRRRKQRPNVRIGRRLAAETLEDRRMLATVIVDTDISFTDGDTSSIANLIASPGADGNISLQEAIQAANNTPNSPAVVPDVIEFAIPGAGPHVIDLSGPLAGLNTITDAVTIDGYSQPGASANTADIDSPINTNLQIVLDGAGVLTGALTITETGGGTTIRGLNIRDFTGTAIAINSSDSNVVSGNFIGTNTAGTAADGNLVGVSIIGDASDNVIGGIANADRNLISGNMVHGVSIGNGANSNTVAGNFIGTQANGTAALGNIFSGVILDSAGIDNLIGGLSASLRNVISGNGNGVRLNNVEFNAVIGNFIGVDRTGTADLGNTNDGVLLENGASNNSIAGDFDTTPSVISGNGRHGVFLDGIDTDLNDIFVNFIGTDVTGMFDLGNAMDGVFLDMAGENSIQTNLISGNNEDGVHLGPDANGNSVRGNLIGLDFSQDALPNAGVGVHIQGASDNIIGGNSPLNFANFISGNGQEGVLITGSTATGNLVRGNFIGVNVSEEPRPNGLDGVEIVAGSNNQIGGANDDEGNLIAFNTTEGVEVAGSTATGNLIRKNRIFNNGTIGIDISANAIEGDGPTANDLADPADDDEDANRQQNFPVFIGSATLLGNSIAFRYRVPTDPTNATYPLTIDFYIADSDNQEGQTFLASDTYLEAEAGQDKVVIIPLPPVLTNNAFVATATDAAGNTSEFSAPVQIQLPTILGSEPTIILPNENININQVNRYQYIAHSTGKTVVRIDFLHLLGDLDLEVRDENGFLLAEGNTSSADQNFEEVELPMVGQETYFINVIAVDFTDDIGQPYALEVENFPSPVPTGVHLDPNDDTGMLNNDGITNETTPTFFIQTDVLNFVDTNNDGFYSDPDFVGPPVNPRDAIHALTAAEAQAIVDGTPQADDEDGGIAVEVTLVNTSTNEIFSYFADPIVALVPEVYQLTVPEELPDGTYLISARTKVFDGQSDTDGNPEQAMGRSDASPPLWITIDTAPPVPGLFDILASSDSGMFTNDNVTNINQPAFFGLAAEPNAKVIVAATRIDPITGNALETNLVGTGVTNSLGAWEVTVEPLRDGKYHFVYLLEDAAGNFSDSVGVVGSDGISVVGISNNDAQALAEPGTIESFIDVSAADFPALVGDAAATPEITDVDVRVNIEHENPQDLNIFLVAPDSTEIELSTGNGSTEFDDVQVLFDGASTRLIAGAERLVGTFEPEGDMDDFDGLSPYGTWTLRITDDTGNDLTGQLVSWTLQIHVPLMVVIDTEAPNTPFLNLVDAFGNVINNNMPNVSMTTHDPGIEFAQLLWQDNLKFRIYDRFENTAEFLLYDSALDAAVDAVSSFGDMFTSLTLINEMLPEQFFNLFGGAAQDAVTEVDGFGKLADGVHNLKLEVEDRAGNISEDFLLEIVVDTSPLLGTWAAGEIVLGPSSHSFTPGHQGYGYTGNTHLIGTDLDYIFAGKFLELNETYQYDTLAAYGRIWQNGAFVYRWLIDKNGNGYIDPATEIFTDNANLIGVPLAGNFDGDATNGDEVGLFTGTQWYLDTNGNYDLSDETPINANYAGFPIAGDFDGDGNDDLATYIATSTGGNLFSVDTNRDGTADYSFNVGSSFSAGIGFSGTRERPVAADFNADGIDDFGLWVPDGINPVPHELSEWYLLLSGDDPSTAAAETTVLDRILDGPLNGYVPFIPALDIYAQHGNTFALPVVGRFAPQALLNLVDGQVSNGDDDEVFEAVQQGDQPLSEQVLALVQIEPVTTAEVDPPVFEVDPVVPATPPTPQPTISETETIKDSETPVEPVFPETPQPAAPVADDPDEAPVDLETAPEEVVVESTPETDSAAAEAPVAPVDPPSVRRAFRRSRSLNLFRILQSRPAPAPVESPVVEAAPSTTPIGEVVSPTETVVVEVAAQPPSTPVFVEPPEEAVVIVPEVVTPEVVTPPVETAPPEQPDTAALEAAFAEVTGVQLSKPDLDPEDELVAEQVEVLKAQAEPVRHRSFRFMRYSRWIG